MIRLSIGTESFKKLYETVIKEQTIIIHEQEGNSCIFIQANPKRYNEGVEYLERLYAWLNHGEYPGLRVSNVFDFHPLNTLKVCVKEPMEDDKGFYELMSDCIDNSYHRDLKPYEHR